MWWPLLLACSGSSSIVVPGGDHGPLVVPKLVLNEVQAKNDSTLQLDDGSLPDWVELYDADDVPVDLSDVTLTDGASTWRGSGVLKPHHRLLLYADGEKGDDHLPFALAREGEDLTLSFHDVPVDHLSTGLVDGDTSWARVPDGGAWTLTTSPTPGGEDVASETTDPTDVLFQTERVLDVALTIPEDGWEALSTDPYTPVYAQVTFEGVTLPCDVHIKGQWGSYRTLDQKAAFKVNVGKEGHEIRGERMLTLNNMVQDPTYVHELLAYTVFRAMGVPAPRVAYAKLTVNGDLFGLYSLVESVDERFLARWWPDPSGNLYEGAYGTDVTTGLVAGFHQDQGEETDYADLYAVAELADQPPTDATITGLEHLVDLDEVARDMAVESGILHWDGYFYPNNYRLYHDPITGRMTLLPWGTDQTFTTLYYAPWDGHGVLHTLCMQNAACRQRYDDHLVEAADVIEGLDLEGTMDDVLALVEPYVEKKDPRKEIDWSTHQSYVDLTRQNIEAAPGWLRDWAAQDR